jgi:hypothetical protein
LHNTCGVELDDSFFDADEELSIFFEELDFAIVTELEISASELLDWLFLAVTVFGSSDEPATLSEQAIIASTNTAMNAV